VTLKRHLCDAFTLCFVVEDVLQLLTLYNFVLGPLRRGARRGSMNLVVCGLLQGRDITVGLAVFSNALLLPGFFGMVFCTCKPYRTSLEPKSMGTLAGAATAFGTIRTRVSQQYNEQHT
jgi:hypothetical protein